MAAHPLTRPASWTLTVGAPEMPLIRWAAAALWSAGGVACLAWLGALVRDVMAGHLYAGYLLLAIPAVLAWLFMAWRIWRRWLATSRPLTLEWRGPVQAGQGGFHVGDWDAPVRVRVALSWHGWLLLSLVRVRDVDVKGGRGAKPTYAWLNARESDEPLAPSRNISLHQLRTLLHLPPAMTTQEGDRCLEDAARGLRAGPPMASWADSFNPGSMLRRLASPFRAQRPPDAATPSRLDTAFPVTTVMAERQVARAKARVRGGGRG